MQFDDMRIFVNTVDAGSFTSAANRLRLSKQFVSRRVAALEADLGARLLVRNTRKLAVTDLGQEFYERARRILADVADTEQAMSARRSEPRGLLKVSAPMSFGMAHLSPLVAEFLRAHPDVHFDMDLSDRNVDVIGEGFDMALRIGRLADSTLIAQKLIDVRMIPCCSPGYRRRHRALQTPDELAHHACLPYGQQGRAAWEFMIDGVRTPFEVHGPLRANNGEVLRDAAVAGLGICYLPDFIVAGSVDAGLLVEVLEPFIPPPNALHVLYPQHREASVTIRAFTQFLRERLTARAATARGGAL
ncbi:LysR family transcriptional regulator [Paraburkholderia pallida]|uniref:LysR family transcriptional regulator n=1 Tax=Paraburkholderia pallida TaxID=2547399 RepID=A0A4P7CW34_9BURK|nr:LysR family transcriptional regulator [Paraburkholderia pallida]QBR00389.1 LysR family transcriptional regulator [Paraburkholderia pallida]